MAQPRRYQSLAPLGYTLTPFEQARLSLHTLRNPWSTTVRKRPRDVGILGNGNRPHLAETLFHVRFTDMNRSDLIRVVSERTGLPIVAVEQIVVAALDVIVEVVETGEDVTIMAFGRFQKRVLPARKAVNPASQEPIQVAECNTVRFIASSKVKDRLNGNG